MLVITGAKTTMDLKLVCVLSQFENESWNEYQDRVKELQATARAEIESLIHNLSDRFPDANIYLG